MSKTAVNIIEYDAITKQIQQYIKGAVSGNSDDMKDAFHQDATIFGYVNGDLFAGPVQQLFEWNEENGPAKNLHVNIVHINVIETVATVQVELDNWTGYRFTDLFTLLKVDGKWKIMNKVFHLHH